jgi:hypothetical protein
LNGAGSGFRWKQIKTKSYSTLEPERQHKDSLTTFGPDAQDSKFL